MTTRTLTPNNATWDDLQKRLHQRRSDPVTRFAQVLSPDHESAPLPGDPSYIGWKTVADFAQDQARAYRKLKGAQPANARAYVAMACLQEWWLVWTGGPLPDSTDFRLKLWHDAIDVLFDALNERAAAQKAERLSARAAEQGRAA